MKIVIIGAGPAGVTVAETVRAHDRSATIVMLSAEPYPPYSPPAMVDHFLTGSKTHFWRGPDWAEQMGVEYHQGAVASSVDCRRRRVQLASGDLIAYDKLVIASGSRLHAPLPGVEQPGVYNFKSLSAAEELIAQVKTGQARTALIVGAGFIGMEIALLLGALGVQVTQVEMLDQVMAGMLDHASAAAALAQLRQRGVQVRLNSRAHAFIGNGRVWGVQMEAGEILQADLFVAATGVKPNLDFLAGSGLTMGWGIQVDNRLRTSDPDIFAAGDVVETPDLLTGQCYVHAILPNAIEQGRVVGLNLAGLDTVYAGAERMNSLKHLGLPIVAVGLKEGDEVLHSRLDGSLRTLYLRDHRLVGFQLVGSLHPAGVLRSLMLQQRDLRPIKPRLLEANFGLGMAAWQALG
jgi:NAD(P)H-nitrite reductase large subunit